MKFSYTTEDADWDRVVALFEQVGWTGRRPDQIRQAFEKSSHVIFIYDADELLAFGRTVDDGQYYALLVDVVVHPERQQAGLGRAVVDYLREKLHGYRFITLTAAPGKEAFYLKLGWQRQGSALIWPVSDEQRSLHVAQ
ncbi:MAG: GNAT family N-acetyltransferase [Sphingomonadaceae bacterium]